MSAQRNHPAYGSASGWPPPRYPRAAVEAGKVEPPPAHGRSRRRLLLAAAAVAALGAAGFVAASHRDSTRPATQGGFVPARSWAWNPQTGVSRYEVTFYRDDDVVLRAEAGAARFVLPASFRFRAGRYRWTVRPYPARATSPTFVDSSFVLTAQAAAEANG